MFDKIRTLCRPHRARDAQEARIELLEAKLMEAIELLAESTRRNLELLAEHLMLAKKIHEQRDVLDLDSRRN